MHVAPQEAAAGAGRGREPGDAATADGRGVVEGLEVEGQGVLGK